MFLVCSDLLNCLKSVCTIVVTTESGEKSLKVIFTKKVFTETVKVVIFCFSDVFPVRPPQKFQVQAKT